MDFFHLQDKARKQTRYLVFLFVVAILAIITTINLLFFWLVNAEAEFSMTLSDWLSQPYWLYISAITLAVILINSLIRSWQLKSNSNAIAQMVNATPVSYDNKNHHETRLVNVVEEMSIASGMPIPKIFIMREEKGINAFVSGLEPSNVTLVVTQGLLDKLNRQELQGVIGHEFSHIFHGDMRINLRLIGILSGILVIGQLGQILLRSSSRGVSSRRGKGNASGVLLAGLGLFVIGYIGLFFGRMIKASISRQREFLADASAVQYTRDKDGISHALYKIRINSDGSLLNSSKAEEMSHMCFANAVNHFFSNSFATHPPINDRIKAINPSFEYHLPTQQSNDENDFNQEQTGVSSFQASKTFEKTTNGNTANKSSANENPANENNVGDKIEYWNEKNNINSQKIIPSVGALSQQQIENAQHLIKNIPTHILNLAKGVSNNRYCYDFVIALLLVNQKQQQKTVAIRPKYLTNKSFQDIIKQLSQLSFKQQHLLLELSLSRIELLDETENKDFIASLVRLVNVDDNISQTEFMIYASTIKRALPSKNQKRINRFVLIKNEVVLFFSMLYQQSKNSPTKKQQQFKHQMKIFGIKDSELKITQFNILDLSQALNKISGLNPLLKRSFIQSSIDVIENDGVVSQDEYELIRLLGAYLDSPIPLSF